MPLFRKRPVVIEAWPAAAVWHTAAHDWKKLPLDIAAAYEKGGWVFLGNGDIVIPTLEGNHTAKPDDWIIKGVKGEFYPCKPDVFDITYEPEED